MTGLSEPVGVDSCNNRTEDLLCLLCHYTCTGKELMIYNSPFIPGGPVNPGRPLNPVSPLIPGLPGKPDQQSPGSHTLQ